MRLFSKRFENKAVTDGLSKKVIEVFEGIKSRVASWLNRKTVSYTPVEWLVLLISFCALTGSYCVYLIISSIW